MRAFWIGVITALGIGIAGGVSTFNYAQAQLAVIKAELPEVDEPGTYRPPLKTRVYSSDGTLLVEIYRENRELLPLDEIPQNLLDATVAMEDRRFREHIGVSPRDIARAAFANAQRQRVVQGGSTITQQLARDLYLSRRKQLRRKIAEALLAVELERKYSKDEILELYLNEINYGKGLYGARTAARTYFGKAPQQLTLAECAALAAIPQRPADYNLYRDPRGAAERRNKVLSLMCEQGYITVTERDRAKLERLTVNPYQPPDWTPRAAPYYTSWAVRELCDLLGEERVYAGGLNVTTNVDLELQATAEQAVRAAVANAAGRGATQGSAVLLEPQTGRVLAIVGGKSWDKSQYNRAMQARRQPGSAFKLFVYTAALDRGYRPTDRVLDEPLRIKQGPGDYWTPKNYDYTWHGEVTLQTALAQSINIPAVKLLQRVGVQTVISYAQRMGIRSPLRPYPSLALGTSEVTLVELVSAYGVLPAGGLRCEPTTIARVEDLEGRSVYEHRPAQVAVLSPRTAQAMTEMLRQVMIVGTGKPAAMDVPCGGKTGTTQNGRDAWFVGFTPRLAGGVWLGDDRNGAMHGVFGGSHCGPAWRRIMRAAIQKMGGAGRFEFPGANPDDPRNSRRLGYEIEITGRIADVEVKICRESDLRATPYCPDAVMRSFEDGTAPTAVCPYHRAPPPPASDEIAVPEPPEPPLAEPRLEAPQSPTAPAPTPPGADPNPTSPAPELDPARTEPRPAPFEPTAPTAPAPTPPKRMPRPAAPVPLVRQYVICGASGLLAKPACPNRITRDFAPAQAPTAECTLH